MSSYNYLGFVEKDGPCIEPVEQVVREYGVGVCSGRHELGNYPYQSSIAIHTDDVFGL